jgi:aminoglycoside phosphotransferase (APT) family kinase protein
MKEAEMNSAFVDVVQRIDPEALLLRASHLTGGVSAQMTVLEICRPDGRTRKLVLRCHGGAGGARKSLAVAAEYRLLQTLSAAGLPVPPPVHLDISCAILPMPYLLLEYVAGAPVFDASAVPELVPQLASILASIHAVDLNRYDLSFLPVQGSGFGPRPAVLDDSLDEGLVREAMARQAPLSRRNVPVLLHGDLWPGNVLWREGQLVAIIDWEDARIGDPVVDLAKSRLETLWAFGPEGMHSFTTQYRALMPHVDTTDLPYWDLAAALEPAGNLSDWGLPADKEQRFRQLHHEFTLQAIRSWTSSR